MRRTELLIQTIGRWVPNDVAFIRSLSYRADQADSTADVHLECIVERRDCSERHWPSKINRRFCVILHFTEVVNFSVKDFGGGDTQITGFDIVDVSNRGLEQVKYEVEDYEGGRIHFLCSDVEVVDVTVI